MVLVLARTTRNNNISNNANDVTVNGFLQECNQSQE